jgi:predicted ester cyclase
MTVEEENKAAMQRVWKELIMEGNTERIDDLIAGDYAYHAPGGHEIRGKEGLKAFIAWFHTSFPDLQFTIHDMIAEGDKVVSFYTMKGTHKSNKPVNFQAIIISRMAEGKEVEVWEFFDRYAIASQLAPGWAKALLNTIERQMIKDRP